MSVHDALHRAVEGRRIARIDRQAAIERDAAEIRRLHEDATESIPADETIPPTSSPGVTDDDT